MAAVLKFGSVRVESVGSYCFCLVVEPADMSRKLLEMKISVCSESLRLFKFHFTN